MLLTSYNWCLLANVPILYSLKILYSLFLGDIKWKHLPKMDKRESGKKEKKK